MTRQAGPHPTPPETETLQDRRANPELRHLIEEMLERVREMNRKVGIWSTEDRARAEAELETVMARVRRLAMQTK
jgi:hypothetical protein